MSIAQARRAVSTTNFQLTTFVLFLLAIKEQDVGLQAPVR
jgi:hypothetical protein